LPVKNGVFVTNPHLTQNQPDNALFQPYDPTADRVLDGVFVAGWARQASVGLVGIAKRDGDWCAQVVERHLAGKAAPSGQAVQATLDEIRRLITSRQPEAVDTNALALLTLAEQEEAIRLGAAEFKFPTNHEMIEAIRLQREA
jgi:ferredoxin--NADP+ reductase